MDNKLKNWADNFKPSPTEEVWDKIIKKKQRAESPKLSFKPNIFTAAIAIFFIVVLIIALNYLHIFRGKNHESSKEKMEKTK